MIPLLAPSYYEHLGHIFLIEGPYVIVCPAAHAKQSMAGLATDHDQTSELELAVARTRLRFNEVINAQRFLRQTQPT